MHCHLFGGSEWRRWKGLVCSLFAYFLPPPMLFIELERHFARCSSVRLTLPTLASSQMIRSQHFAYVSRRFRVHCTAVSPLSNGRRTGLQGSPGRCMALITVRGSLPCQRFRQVQFAWSLGWRRYVFVRPPRAAATAAAMAGFHNRRNLEDERTQHPPWETLNKYSHVDTWWSSILDARRASPQQPHLRVVTYLPISAGQQSTVSSRGTPYFSRWPKL